MATTIVGIGVAIYAVVTHGSGEPRTPGPGKFAYAIPGEPGFHRGIFVQEVDGSGRVDLLAGLSPPFDWDFPVAFALDGTRVAMVAMSEIEPAVAVLDLTTRELQTYPVDEKPWELVWSPDGRRMAFTPRGFDAGDDIHLLTLADGTVRNLTNDDAIELDLAWSPDGNWIAYNGCPESCEQPEMWIVAADGSGKRNLSPVAQGHPGPAAWSPDSQQLAFTAATKAGTAARRWAYVVEIESGLVTPIRTVRADSDFLAWLPDGSLLTHGDGIDANLTIINVASSTTRILTGDYWPMHYEVSPDGKHVAYAGAATISAVDLTTGARRVVPVPPSPHVIAWLPLEPANGASLESIEPVEIPKSSGEFPALAADEIDSEGWPIVDCPGGARAHRVETRRATVCVPTGFERTDDRDEVSGQWVPHWSFSYGGDGGMLMLVLGSLAHPEPFGAPSQCARPQQSTLFGVPAYLCIETFEDSPIPGTFINHGVTWYANAETRTGEYFIRANLTGGQEPDEARALVDGVLTALSHSRIADPSRIEP